MTLIFDIGKTNKKCFLFDENYHTVFSATRHFEEITDDDGFPADNLPEIEKWIKEQLFEIGNKEQYQVQKINFSTYGASFVHVDQHGKPVAPLYNYLKPYPESVLQSFYKKYGDALKIAKETGSPPSGMLNSGFQLYWLKYAKPAVFEKIRWSLHFPQYLSFLFTGLAVSDYTSIGCHTGLWNYEKGDYHDWVYAEAIDRILPPVVPTDTCYETDLAGRRLSVGVGIHDSSAALLPYIRADKKTFLLLSTGTWSVSLNPFSREILSEADLQNDCLNYMRTDGGAVKAARLFLGNEYALQVEKLCAYYKKPAGYDRAVKFDEQILYQLKENFRYRFHFESMPPAIHRVTSSHPVNIPGEQTDLSGLATFEAALHQLMLELIDVQVESCRKAIGRSPVEKIYLDGGFTGNDIFMTLLARAFPEYELLTAQLSHGSALGTAMVISDKNRDDNFLKENCL